MVFVFLRLRVDELLVFLRSRAFLLMRAFSVDDLKPNQCTEFGLFLFDVLFILMSVHRNQDCHLCAYDARPIFCCAESSR